MTDFIVPGVSEFEELQREVKELQKQIAELTAERDDLLYHICPALRAEYEEKIGKLERELLAVKLYLREKQRIIEILQARASMRRQMTVEEAQEHVSREFEQYEEDLKKKAREEEEFQKNWNRTGWHAHDSSSKDEGREEKGSGEDAGSSGNGETGTDQESGADSRRGHEEGGNSASSEDEKKESGEDSFTSQGGKRINPVERLKQLYRKIVKLLHPDVHPNLTEREKELFRMATEAYRNGDLERMEKIWEEIQLSGADGAAFTDSPENTAFLRRLLMKLRMRVRELTAEITRLHSSFPYTIKDFLADDRAVEEKQEDLRRQIQEVREADKALQEFIDLLKQKMEEENL